MSKKSQSNKNSVLISIIEIMIHVVLLIVVPVLFLYKTTDFNKYLLPDYVNYVYLYWLGYLIVIPTLYSMIKKLKK